MKEEAVKPQQPHFRILIQACSKAGHTARAFELYNDFRARQLPRHVGIFADLFNCCALGPDPRLGLEKARALRKRLREDNFTPNKVCDVLMYTCATCTTTYTTTCTTT